MQLAVIRYGENRPYFAEVASWDGGSALLSGGTPAKDYRGHQGRHAGDGVSTCGSYASGSNCLFQKTRLRSASTDQMAPDSSGEKRQFLEAAVGDQQSDNDRRSEGARSGGRIGEFPLENQLKFFDVVASDASVAVSPIRCAGSRRRRKASRFALVNPPAAPSETNEGQSSGSHLACPCQSEAIQHAVVGRDVHPAIGDRESGEVVPGLDLVSTRIQFLAGEGIEGVEHGVGGGLDPQRAEIREAAILIGLTRILAAAVRENDTIGDDRRLGLIHVARHPDRLQVKLAVVLLHFEGDDRAVRSPDHRRWAF